MISQIDFHKLFNMGPGYVKETINNIDNPFWKDILKNWYQFCNSLEVESVKDVLDSPICYNKYFINGHNYRLSDCCFVEGE